MRTQHAWNSTLSMLARTATAVLVCLAGATSAQANDTTPPAFVAAQNIPCRYSLSQDDVKTVEPYLGSPQRLQAAVRVSLNEAGTITDTVLEQSSGNPAFDSVVLQASRRGVCLPYRGIDGIPVAIETNFVFVLKHASPAAEPGTQASAAGVPADGAHSAGPLPPSSPLAALPFALGHAPNEAVWARLGIAPDSPKARLLGQWMQKIATDPDIKQFYSNGNASPRGTTMQSRGLAMFDAMARVSLEDRERLMAMQTRALDNAPPDCGGVPNMVLVTIRYLSFGTQSDDEIDAEMQAIYDLLKQSTQTTPPPQLQADQRLRGQLELSVSMEHALKRDPSEAEDLGLFLGGGQAKLTPVAWCKAARTYQHALDETAQPYRDWVFLTQLENARRSVVQLTEQLSKLPATAPAASQPVAVQPVDYDERVRRRVRPNIIWSGNTSGLETVLEVHCTSAGTLESVRIVRSSGDAGWDAAALRAVQQSDPMPLDTNGEAPHSFEITLRPGP
jgi:TonB family protein